MHSILHKRLSVFFRRKSVVLLALWWFAGFVLGAFTANRVSYSFTSLMRMAVSFRVSIVSSLMVSLLPLSVSALVVYLDKPAGIFAIAFLKAVCYGFCSAGIRCAYGSAAWLVHFLFLFSDNLSVLVLFWFWLRHTAGRKLAVWSDLTVCAVICAGIGILDSCLVSPFLAGL